MNDQILEKMISDFLQYRFKESIFGWQGGEPTLAGLDFFKKVVNFQQKYGESGQVIGNALQTNGILINDDWGVFLHKYQFLVGLSLDGPKKIHDRYRKSIGGKSVWEKVMSAAECLKRNDVAFNILCVISKANVNQAKEVYQFFLDNGFYYLQFIPALETDQLGKKASFTINASQFGKFLCDIFDEWKINPYLASIRLFSGIIAHHLGLPKGYCAIEEKCADYLLIEWNGDVYPCDFFVEHNYKLGNLMNENLSKLKNKRDTSFIPLKKTLADECTTCKWLKLCYGGCIKDRIFPDNPNNEKSYFCKSYQKFFQYTNDWFIDYAEKVRNSR